MQATAWWDSLAEGVLLVEGSRVVDLNAAAAQMLDVLPRRARGAPLIGVVRDHRLEAAWRTGRAAEVELRGRRVEVLPIGAGLLLRDVTVRRKAEENARELLAVLSHELRTPVTAIRAVIEALSADPSPELAARFLPRAGQEAERLTRLLDDLTVEVKPPSVRRVPVLQLTERVLASLQPLLDQHAVRVRLDLPDVVALVDEDKLFQVLVNLVGNAVVHGPAHELVEVAGLTLNGWLRLEVLDAGPKLDPAAVEGLFEPHARGRGNVQGAGLGLYIVRSIAERWGGQAWGGPRPGEGGVGNVFGVSVPLA